MFKRAQLAALIVILAASGFISGCGLLNKGKEKLDPPKEVSYLKEGEEIETSPKKEGEEIETSPKKEGEEIETSPKKEGEEQETTGEEEKESTVMRDLYLIDRNGLVVSQSLPLPASDSAAKQALEYLVADGPVTDILPNGFRTVLPADTAVDVDIQDGTAIVDFSEEFANYEAKDEKKILQAITWTLTQFDTIDRVELRMNGHKLNEMPVDKTPLSEKGVSRQDGINVEKTGVADITNTRPLTVYYLAQSNDKPYYVPVTKRVSNTEMDDVTAIVNELIEGPGMMTALVSGMSSDIQLLEEPKIKEGVVTLNFNEAVLGSSKEQMISEETLQSLVLSLTELNDVKSVAISVEGKKELVNEKGEPLTAPVSRPEKVNTGSY
ncbi:GerMN domain-containing protein [Siminovitchia sp. FSL H7-0308]|uniref:GerMN domain-containing protein n=1 Tax=Siminovitchia sp. FSL H7-0308 TaxID=2921432 RepID=UPI0030EB6483